MQRTCIYQFVLLLFPRSLWAKRETAVPGQKRLEPVSGFTLTELLAVAAVVGILATLLLPALTRAKEAARTAVCLSNLHQFSVAAAEYAADNQGLVPTFWEWLYATPGPAISHDLTTGTLYPYLGNKAAYLCPADKLLPLSLGPEARRHSVMSKRDYSYAMNCVVCHEQDLAKFIVPQKTLLWLEANLEPDDFTGIAGPVAGPSAMRVTKAIATRHRGSGHLLFGDLHVERRSASAVALLERSKRFWLPHDDDRYNLSPILPDP